MTRPAVVSNQQTADIFFHWIAIRLRLMMEAATQTTDANVLLHVEIAASKELLIKYGHERMVEDLVREHEAKWRPS